MTEYSCVRGIHAWPTRRDAGRCCNGWIRLTVPFRYGLTRTVGGDPVGRDEWYVPGYLWKTALIPEEDVVEIERLLALCPMEMRSSTQDNHWIGLMQ